MPKEDTLERDLSHKTLDGKIRQKAAETLRGGKRIGGFRRLIPFLGPAFIASIAYVDPGNFATNIESGAKFGYTLLWVIVASNLMAMLLQALAAKLGIATNKNLAENCREYLPTSIVIGMWIIMEVVAMATDLAEFLGAALGFYLLFGTPLLIGAGLTAVATIAILALERYGFRPLEAVVSSMIGIISICYLVTTIIDKPVWGDALRNSVVPGFAGTESVVLAVGILGATVMPHAIYLHSALTQNRILAKGKEQLRRLFRFELTDVLIAMTIAGFVNMAILIMAASVFHQSGLINIASIESAYRTLVPLFGPAAGWVFAISLLAAGLSSSMVGTRAGQIIMQGFLHRHIPVMLRRFVTIIPSIVVIAMKLDPTSMLVLSQVVLSFGLPFAVVPLIIFTARKDIMGWLVNRPITTILASLAASLIIGLNIFLLYRLLLMS